MEITEMVPRARMQIPHSARFGKGETSTGSSEGRGGEGRWDCVVLQKILKILQQTTLNIEKKC